MNVSYITNVIRQHPAWLIITCFYTLCWLWLLYIGYHDYTNHGDGETIGMSLFGALVFLFAPYFLITLVLAFAAKSNKTFYGGLCCYSIMPVAINLIWAGVLHW